MYNIMPNTAYCYKQYAYKRIRGSRKTMEVTYYIEISPNEDGSIWSWKVSCDSHHGVCMSSENTEEKANDAAYDYIHSK